MARARVWSRRQRRRPRRGGGPSGAPTVARAPPAPPSHLGRRRHQVLGLARRHQRGLQLRVVPRRRQRPQQHDLGVLGQLAARQEGAELLQRGALAWG
jgi:hypothetical protein